MSTDKKRQQLLSPMRNMSELPIAHYFELHSVLQIFPWIKAQTSLMLQLIALLRSQIGNLFVSKVCTITISTKLLLPMFLQISELVAELRSLQTGLDMMLRRLTSYLFPS